MMTDFNRRHSLSEMNHDLNFELNRRPPMSKSMMKRLSVTTLLKFAELQAENISNKFQMIDKEKYQANYSKNKTITDSTDSLDDIGNYKMSLLDEVKLKKGSDVSQCVWFGVTFEHIVLSNKLKVSIERRGLFQNELGRKKRYNLFAKVFMLPRKSEKQTVEVTSSSNASSMLKPAVFFQRFASPSLVRRELGVKIYLKQGMFRKHVVIHEWSISMDNIDLVEPQTVWKKID